MRKKIALLLVVCMVSILAMGSVASAEPKIGQALYAAHSDKAFCVATVVMDGDKIVDALIDEFQFVSPDTFTGVPNTAAFTNADGYVLASKRLNSEPYSANMVAKAGATQPLLTSYEAIEAFVTGKTIAELEEAIKDKTSEQMVDVVSSSTLVDTLGYINALIAAAKSIQ